MFDVHAQVVGPTLAMLRARSAQQQVQLAQLRGIKAALLEAEQQRRSRPRPAGAALLVHAPHLAPAS